MFRVKGVAASLVSMAVALSMAVMLAGCSVQKDKDGSAERVKIQTPVGGLNVNTSADAKDTGLTVYPGAKPSLKPEGKDNSANVNLSSSIFGVKVVTVEFLSDDSPDKVKEYYKKEMAKFGSVLDCKNGIKEEGNNDQITCSDTQHGDSHHAQLVVGTKQRQHIVSIEPNGNGTKFGLVYVQLRGKEGSL